MSIHEEDIAAQRDWSLATFGPGERLRGVLTHLYNELCEVGGSNMMLEISQHAVGWEEGDPKDPSEWADLLILAIDGAMRQGVEPRELLDAYHAKMSVNIHHRQWPDWRRYSEDEPIEHVKDTGVTP